MCGRYSLTCSSDDLAARFDISVPGDWQPRYNCAPGQQLPVVTGDDSGRLDRMEWGLTPSWADEPAGHINARAETITEKRSFSEAFERRRCLVPADGFYEWVERDGGKRPYRVVFEDDRVFAMAGVWERWTPASEQAGLEAFGGAGAASEPEPRETFAVVTTDPNDVVSPLHHRMAVVLDPAEEREWLDSDPREARELLDTHPGDDMHAYEVTTRVNDPANDDPALVEPATDGQLGS